MKKFIIVAIIFTALLIGCQTYEQQMQPCSFNINGNYTIYRNETNETYTYPLDLGSMANCSMPYDKRNIEKFTVPVGEKYKGKECCYPPSCEQSKYNPQECSCMYFIACPPNSPEAKRGSSS
jgi:hypothetical protein